MHFLKYMYALKWLLRFVSGCSSQLVIPNGVPSLVLYIQYVQQRTLHITF